MNINTPSTKVGTNMGGSTNDYFSMSLQHVIHSLSVVWHNISVAVLAESTGNSISNMTLFVLSYYPYN